jgi:ArsR family transcriptional regulator
VTATNHAPEQLLQISGPGAVPDCEPGTFGDELSPARAEGLARLLKALADPVRLRLYSRIAGARGEVCVCDIQDVGVSQPTVSHHLRKLREAGLIDCERRGTWVYYWALPGRLDLLDQLPRP